MHLEQSCSWIRAVRADDDDDGWGEIEYSGEGPKREGFEICEDALFDFATIRLPHLERHLTVKDATFFLPRSSNQTSIPPSTNSEHFHPPPVVSSSSQIEIVLIKFSPSISYCFREGACLSRSRADQLPTTVNPCRRIRSGIPGESL